MANTSRSAAVLGVGGACVCVCAHPHESGAVEKRIIRREDSACAGACVCVSVSACVCADQGKTNRAGQNQGKEELAPLEIKEWLCVAV